MELKNLLTPWNWFKKKKSKRLYVHKFLGGILVAVILSCDCTMK